MTCLPCAKEIIDGFAHKAYETSESIREKVPEFVAAGRLKASEADEILTELIRVDEKYIAGVQKVGKIFSDYALPPWGA